MQNQTKTPICNLIIGAKLTLILFLLLANGCATSRNQKIIGRYPTTLKKPAVPCPEVYPWEIPKFEYHKAKVNLDQKPRIKVKNLKPPQTEINDDKNYRPRRSWYKNNFYNSH